MRLDAMIDRVSQRLNELAGPVFYPESEIRAALNEAQRLFCLLTLGLEQTSQWTVPANTPFHHMLAVFPDWIVALRITAPSGAKIRPARLEDLASLDNSWWNAPGDPERYAALGADFIALYKQPAAQATLYVTYARAALPLVTDADTPEIPEEYHQALVAYAIYRMRQVEGAQEFEKALKHFEVFLNAADHYAAYVRSRNIGGRYDKVPVEIEKTDRSKLLKLRPDLPPARKAS